MAGPSDLDHSRILEIIWQIDLSGIGRALSIFIYFRSAEMAFRALELLDASSYRWPACQVMRCGLDVLLAVGPTVVIENSGLHIAGLADIVVVDATVRNSGDCGHGIRDNPDNCPLIADSV